MKIKLFIFILLIFSAIISLATITKLDSLEAILKESSGKLKVDILNELISSYFYKPYNKLLKEDFHWNKVIDYCTRAYELSKKLKYKKGEILSLMNTAYIHLELVGIEMSITQYGKIVTYKIKNEKRDLGINKNWKTKSDSLFYKAIEFYERAFEKSKQYKEDFYSAKILIQIGLCYENLEKYPESLGHYLNSLEIQKKSNNKPGITLSFSAKAVITI